MNFYYFITSIIYIINHIINIFLRNRLRFYSKFYLKSNMSGREIAEKMLIDNGINDVKIYPVQGELVDYYDPSDKTINLSEIVFYGKNIVSAAIATHECGHALQHRIKDNLLKFRNNLSTILNFSSRVSNISIISGLIIFYNSEGRESLILKIGIGLFLLIVIFSLITLPIEFNASDRALSWLKEKKLVKGNEYFQVKKLLNFAIMTYIISALGNLTQLTYFMSILNNSNSNNSDNINDD
ncbi:zinc metallopeptidase [Blattabacterium cuenoti]|uniref:zinc metallopeptidase n=1 Tax=Blattabacterium cuenoti TaxID=1653831 RepID=UPI00163B9679|nr:zinc metallopeptidase [Blattabacterium cuenoti]